jgi:hypothetical protein
MKAEDSQAGAAAEKRSGLRNADLGIGPVSEDRTDRMSEYPWTNHWRYLVRSSFATPQKGTEA